MDNPSNCRSPPCSARGPPHHPSAAYSSRAPANQQHHKPPQPPPQPPVPPPQSSPQFQITRRQVAQRPIYPPPHFPPERHHIPLTPPFPPTACSLQRQRFVSHSGPPGISIWRGLLAAIRPLLSFQVYVTYDTSTHTPAQLDALADALWAECTNAYDDDVSLLRLDIILFGNVAPMMTRNNACLRHYMATADVAAEKERGDHPLEQSSHHLHHHHPFSRPVPACRHAVAVYKGFLIVVPEAAWRENWGLGLLFFDPVPPGAVGWLGEGGGAWRRQQQHEADLVDAEDEEEEVVEGDDGTVFVYPTRPTYAIGCNLWTWHLDAVWRSMGVVEAWGRAYYEELERCGEQSS